MEKEVFNIPVKWEFLLKLLNYKNGKLTCKSDILRELDYPETRKDIRNYLNDLIELDIFQEKEVFNGISYYKFYRKKLIKHLTETSIYIKLRNLFLLG